MTTAKRQLPPMRPFTPDECEALVAAGIIGEGEQHQPSRLSRQFDGR